MADAPLQDLESQSGPWFLHFCAGSGWPVRVGFEADEYADARCPECKEALTPALEMVPRATADALAEALATIAVDISKYESDSEGLVWRVKLAHEAHAAFLAAYPPREWR